MLYDNAEAAGYIARLTVGGVSHRPVRRFAVERQIEIMRERARGVTFDDIRFLLSPIELQIPYKLYLGSDKDIEDAVYLWMVFREMLDSDLLRSFMERLHVRGEPYGIEV